MARARPEGQCLHRQSGGETSPVDDRALTASVHRAISAASVDHPGLVIGSVQITPGWGDILFVRLRARGPTTRPAQEAVEEALRTGVRHALEGRRTAVSVTWTA